MTDAIEIIHRDHVNLGRFLNVLETVVDGLVPDQPKPNLELLYSAFYYTWCFPTVAIIPRRNGICSGRFGCDALKNGN